MPWGFRRFVGILIGFVVRHATGAWANSDPVWRPRGLVFGLALVLSACVGPSAAEREERQALTQRLMQAHAVHLPPADRSPCVGVTVRLTQPDVHASSETTAPAVTDAEADDAVGEALSACTARFEEARIELALGPEPNGLLLGYGVDPRGKVCAVVQAEPVDLIDPSSRPLVESAARCAKEALFGASFPAGRVEGDERAVLRVRVSLGGPRAVRSSTGSATSEEEPPP